MEIKDYKKYKRFPIELGGSSIMLIHLFSSNDSLKRAFESQDMFEQSEVVFEYECKSLELAAKQFFDQLEGHYSDAFLDSLITEATKRLNESDKHLYESSKKWQKEEDKENRALRALEKAKNFTKII